MGYFIKERTYASLDCHINKVLNAEKRFLFY